MPCWDGLDLLLALWAPLVVAGSIVGAWALLTPRETAARRLDAPARRRLEPGCTSTMQAMLDLAEGHASAWQAATPRGSLERAGRAYDRNALQLTTLVAISLVRDWTSRLDQDRLGPHAAPVIDDIRSHANEALVLLSSLPTQGEAGEHLHPEVLQQRLAQLASDLRRFQNAVRPAGLDPYR